jgi:hypothetical protein
MGNTPGSFNKPYDAIHKRHILGGPFECLRLVFHRATLHSEKNRYPGIIRVSIRIHRVGWFTRNTAFLQDKSIGKFIPPDYRGWNRSKSTIGCNGFNDRPFHLKVLSGKPEFRSPICSGRPETLKKGRGQGSENI